jgi:hypothetical protein
MAKSKSSKISDKKIQNNDLTQFEKNIKALSNEDLKDLLLINSYKLALTKSQLEALCEILISKKVMTYEEFWKLTNEKFKNVKP